MRGRRRLTGRARDRSFRLSVVRSFYFNPSHPPDGTRLRRSVRYFRWDTSATLRPLLPLTD